MGCKIEGAMNTCGRLDNFKWARAFLKANEMLGSGG